MPLRRVLTLAAIAVLGATSTASAATKIHIRGTAYAFNDVKVTLGGAKIKVAEIPSAGTTVKADGTYDLTVPDKSTVTPYIEFPGYNTVYLQTFSINGEDLEHVNFQTPSTAVAGALGLILGVPVDANNYPVKCVIVSTFSTRNVRGLDVRYKDFIGYGAHGVAGATATISPAAASPVYFNEKVIPDRAQLKSSKDGGVIWSGLAPGVYTVKASAPGTRFASFKATCKDGRIVNANPPWGLHELGKKNPTTVKATWKGTTLQSLKVSKLPKGAKVVKAGSRTLKPGRTYEVSITAPAYDGLVVRWRLNAAGKPTQTKLCLPLGNTEPRTSC